ncbi:hypothetical protein ACWG0P_05805 [Amedibacillus sp. YH-ame6]
MERNLLVGNGINIQFGGVDVYSSSAIMNRVVKNIKAGKYTALIDNSLSPDEQLGFMQGMVDIINQIKDGKHRDNADGLFMLMELDRISRTYPVNSTITSVFLEDYFLAFEIFNNQYRAEDGEKQSEVYRKTLFTYFRQVLVDGIYNEGAINDVFKNFYPGMNRYIDRFDNIFTTNYDSNLENILGNSDKVFHLHGEFEKLAPEYDVTSLYYNKHKTECDLLIHNKIPNYEHIYGDEIMSWSWLDKYGGLIEPDTKRKEDLFESISGQLEILGLSPTNDEHLFMLINNNSKITSVVYYYFNDTDRCELSHHIKKPVTYKKVKKLWNTMQ